MDLVALLRTIRQEWLPAVLVLAAVLLGTAYFAVTPEDRFRATASLLVTPKLEGPGGPDTSRLQVVQYLLPVMEASIRGQETGKAVVDKLPRQVAAAPWGVTTSVEPGKPIVFITVRSGDRRVVAPVALAYAQVLQASPPYPSLVNVELLDRPGTPLEPYAPNRTSIMISGVVLGLLLAVGAALVSRTLRRPHRLADEIQGRLRRTVLGEIPPSPRLTRLLRPTQLFDGSDAAGVEPYMRLRANLEIQLASRGPTSITVTSRSQNEGKSTITALLGWALASAGHPVTLVDGDLRRPTLARYLGVEGRLPDNPDGEIPVVSTGLPQLSLVSAHSLRRIAGRSTRMGSHERHPSEVLLTALPPVLAATARAEQLVLVDAPPVLGAAEALLSCAQTEAVIVVVDARRRSAAEDLEAVLSQIEEADGQVLGVVLNRARLSRHQHRQLARYAVSLPVGDLERRATVHPPDPGPAGPGGVSIEERLAPWWHEPKPGEHRGDAPPQPETAASGGHREDRPPLRAIDREADPSEEWPPLRPVEHAGGSPDEPALRPLDREGDDALSPRPAGHPGSSAVRIVPSLAPDDDGPEGRGYPDRTR